MRAPVVLLALLLAAPLPTALAQGAAGGEPVLTDAKGDLRVELGDDPHPLPESRFKALDLVAAFLGETEEGFTVTVQVAGLDQPPEVPGFDDSILVAGFRHNDQDYQTVFVRALGDQSYYWGFLLKTAPDGSGSSFQRVLEVEADPAAATVSAAVYRDELLDRKGAAPFPGRALDAFWAASTLRTRESGGANINGINPFLLYNVRDRMPDSGYGTKAVPILLGLAQSGHAALWSPEPVRASNGEATTYVFNVSAQNAGSQADLFAVSATNVPRDWTVTIPDTYLRIGAGETTSFPVLVSTPFTHAHGTLAKFRVEMRSESEPNSVGRVDLGVRYFAIPQPGGHHSLLHMHATKFGSGSPLFQVIELAFAGNSGQPYMNTLETDPADANAPVSGQFWGYGCRQSCPPETPRTSWRWWVFLQPTLEMGLDFDLERQGTLRVPVQAQAPLPQAHLTGWLIHTRFDEPSGQWQETIVANFTGTPKDLLAGESHVFEFPFQASPASDYLLPAKRAYLGVILDISTPKPGLFTGAEAPLLVPGGTLDLPLFEFRDRLDQAFATIGAVRLEILSEPERRVNPGESALFRLRLTNDLDEDHTFRLEATGPNVAWARFVEGMEVTVPGRSAAEIHVAVTLPATATDRDAVDLVLRATSTDDPDVRALTRIVALVELGRDHPDESVAIQAIPAPEAKSSPGPVAGLGAVLTALAALAARRRGGRSA